MTIGRKRRNALLYLDDLIETTTSFFEDTFDVEESLSGSIPCSSFDDLLSDWREANVS